MKRTLAVLLTFFVLTYSACADELVDVAWHVDSEMLGEFLASCGFNEKIAATVSDAAEHIGAHLSGKATVREDGGHFVLSFDETDLIDADWIQMEQNWRIHTSLLPGIQLEMPDINGQVLAATFKQVSDHVQACIQDMEPTEEHGRFWGYTYQSGDRRIRYSFDQKKLAGLLCAVMEKLGVSDDQQIKELRCAILDQITDIFKCCETGNNHDNRARYFFFPWFKDQQIEQKRQQFHAFFYDRNDCDRSSDIIQSVRCCQEGADIGRQKTDRHPAPNKDHHGASVPAGTKDRNDDRSRQAYIDVFNVVHPVPPFLPPDRTEHMQVSALHQKYNTDLKMNPIQNRKMSKVRIQPDRKTKLPDTDNTCPSSFPQSISHRSNNTAIKT